MNIFKKYFGNTGLYKFARWLLVKYQQDQAKVYDPKSFRHYGKDVLIGGNVSINCPERVVLKDRCAIFNGSVINSLGGLYVGENTGIGYNCTIFTVQHHYRNAEMIPFDCVGEMKPVIIREYVWIAEGVKIPPGIEIGEGAIVGMGAVVTKNVPPLAIVMGNPAEIIGYRSKDHYYRCKDNKRYRDIAIGEGFTLRMVPMYKKKYKKELEELGLLESP